jgi:hypothetical protein
MIGLMTIAVAASAIQTAPVTTTKAPILTNEQAARMASLPAINRALSDCDDAWAAFFGCITGTGNPDLCEEPNC